MDTYEKKYKDALNDMRAIYLNLKGDAKLAVEHAFPELRESEDEKVRKRPITLVEQFAQGAAKKPMLAYLEKQEQKPRWKINNPHTTIWTKEMIDEKFEELVDPKQGGWSKEDEMYLSQAIETLKHENYLILADKLKSILPVKSAWSEEDIDRMTDFLDTLESEKPMQEGVDEEIDRLWESFADEMEGPHNLFDMYARLARHFAEWGAEHLKK